jgi:hypothetical protein
MTIVHVRVCLCGFAQSTETISLVLSLAHSLSLPRSEEQLRTVIETEFVRLVSTRSPIAFPAERRLLDIASFCDCYQDL